MIIKKKDVNKILTIFLLTHIVLWTVIPSISNNNLPLDTLEALAWGNDMQLGYEKHPPLSAWFLELFYQIFGSQDWAYYFLSQLFVVTSFIIIFKFSEDFFQNRIHSLISVLLLEGIYFYNFTSPEFNVNVCQLPFWTLTVFYCWKAVKQNNNTSWLLFGFFAGLGFLSKYLFLYLILGIIVFFTYNLIKDKKFNFKWILSSIIFFIVISPHLVWLVDNNYATIFYAFFRSINNPLSGLENLQFLNHILHPIIFLIKQIGILIPFFLMSIFIISKFKTKINFKDKKFLFLFSITIIPLILVFFTSLITGAKIRTMGMTPFYLFIGVFFIYMFQAKINLIKIKNFFIIFLILFITSPLAYYLTSFLNKNERTDYPGEKIATSIQSEWKHNFSNEISTVVGYGWINAWYAQSLSYHLESRPKWKSKLENNLNGGVVLIKGFNKINNCDGFFYQVESLNDICMIGKK